MWRVGEGEVRENLIFRRAAAFFDGLKHFWQIG